MSSIWAAPFLGEFGWECSVWSPWLRYQQDRLQLPMTVVCEEGKALLYSDFAEVVEQEPSVMIRDCQHALTPRGGKLVKEDYENYVTKAAGGAQKCITPIDLSVSWAGGPPAPRYHVYKSYKVKPVHVPTIAIHARDHQHGDRNWPLRKWDELLEQVGIGWHVTVIGSKDGAMMPADPRCDDWRGVPLERLAELLSNACCIVGPSSGPLAFAMLCELPVVWWSGHAKNGPRFDSVWNPFDVPVTHVAPNWNPTVDQVREACRRYW